ncbi:MAG: hypothetical protein NUV98_04510 [Candidatus Roizmanbacteria bacterium]|nr:hypothetical protein [Candidatus Roizmanbacteria bacterium]
MFHSLFKKPLLLAIFLFCISLFLRTIWLDKIPTGIVHDNMIFVLNAKAFYYTGSDVSSQWNPLSFSPIPDEPAQAELPYILLAPVIGPLSSSLFAAHIFYAVINSFFVVILFLIALKLMGKWQALIIGLVACFNPWSIFFSRAAFEVSLALSFYMAGLYVLLVTTGWKKTWAVIPLAAGFYTYMAYKITFIPYVLIICFFAWYVIDRKKYLKQYLVILAICLMIFTSFLVKSKTQNTADRMGEVSVFSTAEVENHVNLERRLSVKNPATTLFSNKVSVGLKTSISKYVGAFSPIHLFVDTEKTDRFHLFNHGYFYYADALFLLLGCYYLFVHNRKLWFFLTGIILLGPLPSVVSNVGISYAMRASLYIPFFYIFIGLGIWYALESVKKKKYKNLVLGGIAGIYTVLIANFLYTYFFLQPVYASEGTAFSARILSHYAALANKDNKPVTIVLNSPRVLFKDFVYYADIYNRETAPHIREAFVNAEYSYQNITFTTCDGIDAIDESTIYIFDPGEKCPLFENALPTISIAQLFDSGTVYAVYQDTLCNQHDLKPYISNLSMNDFSVEKLSPKDFCETFIVDFQK